MHSIERYGIVALLFLVVTVVAVLMWDVGTEKKPDAATAKAPPAAAKAPDESAAGRRLSLYSEGRPGPLERGRARRAAAQEDAPRFVPPVEDAGNGDAPEAELPLVLHALPEGEAPVQAEPPRTQSPARQPVREEVVGQAQGTHSYTVRPGDTLSEIALHELGSSRRWQEIVAANPGLDPGRLQVGKPIVLPGAAAAGRTETRTAQAAPKSEAAPSKAPAAGSARWTVGKGENLWKIAEKTLGDGKRWREIAALNPKVNPDKLLLGQVLVVPAAPSTRTASAPSAAKPERLVANRAEARPASRGGKVK